MIGISAISVGGAVSMIDISAISDWRCYDDD